MSTEIIDPEEILSLLRRELPSDVISQIFIAGSLAAAYHHREMLTERGVRTKDADLVIHPSSNVAAARAIADKLTAEGWQPRQLSGFQPGNSETPAHELPAIRLYPPGHRRYFVELLIVPDAGVRRMEWRSVEIGGEYYGLAMFEFMALAARKRLSANGIDYANPRMMALANLLSHPTLDRDPPMSTAIDGRDIHRSSKDLGRVLALARLASPAELDEWADEWLEALKDVFSMRWRELAGRAGSGLRALLEDSERFEEAHHTCDAGLLRGHGVAEAMLRATADRLFDLVIEPVERAAGDPTHA